MVTTPVFTAPIADRLTGDRVRSVFDSRLSGDAGPLWAAGRVIGVGPTMQLFRLLTPSLGDVLRKHRTNYTTIVGMGGNKDVVWLCRRDTGRIYDLDPLDFSVRRSREAPHPTAGNHPRSVGGDNVVLWFYQSYPSLGSYPVYKMDAQTLGVIRMKRFPQLSSIGGDQNVAWIVKLGEPSIQRLSPETLVVVDEARSPFAGAGHRAIAIGGSMQRVFCLTRNPNNKEYLHVLNPRTLEVVHSYGAIRSGFATHDLGGT